MMLTSSKWIWSCSKLIFWFLRCNSDLYTSIVGILKRTLYLHYMLALVLYCSSLWPFLFKQQLLGKHHTLFASGGCEVGQFGPRLLTENESIGVDPTNPGIHFQVPCLFFRDVLQIQKQINKTSSVLAPGRSGPHLFSMERTLQPLSSFTIVSLRSWAQLFSQHHQTGNQNQISTGLSKH